MIVACVAFGQTRLLIDNIHGHPVNEDSQPVNFETLFPDCEIDYLAAENVIMTEILDSGWTVVDGDVWSLSFAVPAGADHLFLRYSPEQWTQHWAVLINPDGAFLSYACNGLAYVENPVPGNWQFEFTSYLGPTSFTYEIGLGPSIFTPEFLSEYDAVLQVYDDMMGVLYGYLPDHTANEMTALTDFIESGGSYLFYHEPESALAWKPVIRLTSENPAAVEIQLDVPGLPFMHEPAADTELKIPFVEMNWYDILTTPDKMSEILYEFQFPSHLNYLTAKESGTGYEVSSQAPFRLDHLVFFQYQAGKGFVSADVETLDTGSVFSFSWDTLHSPMDFRTYLLHVLTENGSSAGLPSEESSAFFKGYPWVTRWLTMAVQSGELCAVYQYAGDRYNDMIPLSLSEAPEKQARVMWTFTENIPTRILKPFVPEPAAADYLSYDTASGFSGLAYYEMGVTEDRYRGVRNNQRYLNFLDFGYVDNDEFCLEGWETVFTDFDDNPAAQIIGEGISGVASTMPAAVHLNDAPNSFPILMGDESNFCPDISWLPEPVAAGQYIGNGRFIGINDRHILNENPDNIQFARNCLDWLTAPEYALGDINQDNELNVLDIVLLVNIIISPNEPTVLQMQLGDMNSDGELNVLDVVQLLNLIIT